MATPMLDSELNELAHRVADELEKYTDGPVDRIRVNDALSALIADFGIQLEED